MNSLKYRPLGKYVTCLSLSPALPGEVKISRKGLDDLRLEDPQRVVVWDSGLQRL